MFILKEQFNPGCLPAPLAQKYRSADGPALRAALYLLCEGGCADAQTLAAALGMGEAVAERSLAYWESAGLVAQSADASAAAPAKRKKETPPQASARPPLTSEAIGELSLRDGAIAALFQESEAIVGRPLDTLETRMLAEIYAYDKLPVDVVLTIVAYCAPRAKSNRKIIALASRTAAEWSEQGICDSARADAQVRLLERREKNEAAVADALSLRDKEFSRAAKAHIARWFEEYHYDIGFVQAALARLQSAGNPVDNPVAYINTILKDWYNSGYTSVRDTMERAANIQPTATARRRQGENSMMKLALDKRKKHKEASGSGVQ
ncbi:MAG: DnaD domain protein [Oscillospiraceae bacterium]|nr:DnaD domain protein [Oscillospiraceae bacterium]